MLRETINNKSETCVQMLYALTCMKNVAMIAIKDVFELYK